MTKIKLANLNGSPEIFHSVQGEGKNMGNPSVFIRTSLCNLHCIWCDTDYTWNWEKTRFKHNKDKDPNYKKYKMNEMILELTIEDIYKRVKATNCYNIVLTGGEPMLQKDELAELMEFFKKKDEKYFFEIETNGTIIPTPQFDNLIDQYNVSPKLKNSNNPKKLREKPKAYRFFSDNEKSVFKFVVSNKEDLNEILDIISKYSIKNDKIYLMPEGINKKELKERQLWLVEICKKYNMKYTDRLHIHIFGDKRGV
jgi:7-carboxy-7-deazaguanine synthase